MFEFLLDFALDSLESSLDSLVDFALLFCGFCFMFHLGDSQ
ncbi:hypothetical protein [Helicobacter fennelliae]|uniref:Uncharacterized protein n=1 Tax=Helicobacter fennelliae MRY12-0050 TaxID=1325130 RepID=T1CYR2_9HELI|nr:hypothetical protein [Helicobacter fennelliae]GAD19070.1 hypothetical protein HFN_0201 [Helicobacter fennelliae MRY12-0050]